MNGAAHRQQRFNCQQLSDVRKLQATMKKHVSDDIVEQASAQHYVSNASNFASRDKRLGTLGTHTKCTKQEHNEHTL